MPSKTVTRYKKYCLTVVNNLECCQKKIDDNNSYQVNEFFNRSGEVLVETELVQSDISLTRDELSRVFTYHIFTFYSVLRLEKYPMVFNSSEEHNCVVFVPLVKSAVGTR